jgi:hypothetical protein
MGAVRPSPTRFAQALVPLVLVLAGCDDNKKLSEQGAVDELSKLAPVLKEDVEQVRRGLPQGAIKLSPRLDDDTLKTPPNVQKAIAAARASVHDLELAKSTFFSFAAPDGKVIASEATPDLLAEHSMFTAFPALKKAADPGSGVVEAFGEMKELRGVRTGPDLAWVAAVPVKDDKGQAKGIFVTGWSMRALAFHLETTAKMHITEATEKAGKKVAPIVYVYVVKGKTAYGTPLTPEVNARAIENLDIPGKAAAGMVRGAVEITGRAFGYAGVKAPELGDDAALALLLSEI